MPSLSTFLHHLLYTTGLLEPPLPPAPQTPQQPTYAIAHRVLRPSAVTAALSHGANALEVDLTAWDSGWWADHSGSADSAGATAHELFSFIANERAHGQNIIFVWLDIKNPNYCDGEEDEENECSIEALRDLVRDTLEPVGVRALYGFYQTEDSRGFEVMSETLNDNEAICLSGDAGEVMLLYEEFTSDLSVGPAQRVMDYGWPQLEYEFGNCHELEYYTCSGLRHGRDARNQGQLGLVMGWTSTAGDKERVGMMLGWAGVDGIIYGFQEEDYADADVPREALNDIVSFVEAHGEDRRMATVEDSPW